MHAEFYSKPNTYRIQLQNHRHKNDFVVEKKFSGEK